MSNIPKISLDAMGGDDAPNIVVNGADLALNKYPNLKLIFVGNYTSD